MKKILLTFMLLAGVVSAAWAQVDDVTLVVSGEGATKDEATTKALRSAIEQAFGVFVSANTEILNDELVRDEIATVSSGNIKSYQELGTIAKANGNTEVSLQATVSVKQLTTYAQSHGSSAEFSGATFVANMKQVELNKKNTKVALENLYRQIEAIGKDLYDCELELGTPNVNGELEVKLNYFTNNNAAAIGDLIFSTLSALSIDSEKAQTLAKQGVTIYHCVCVTEFWASASNEILTKKLRGYAKYPYSDFTKGFDVFHLLYPVNLPTIIGRNPITGVYDNMGNQYDFVLKKYQSQNKVRHVLSSNDIFRDQIKKNILNNWEKGLLHMNLIRQSADYGFSGSYFINTTIISSMLLARDFDEETREALFGEQSYRALYLTESRILGTENDSICTVICIPSTYTTYYNDEGRLCIPKQTIGNQTIKKKTKKGKKEEEVKIPPFHKPLCTIEGIIAIPPERLSQITNIYVK